MYYVYILENTKGGHYIGSCRNVEERLKRHNQNSVRSTKNKGPFQVIYKQDFGTRTEARKTENQFKRYKNVAYLKSILDKKLPPSSSLA